MSVPGMMSPGTGGASPGSAGTFSWTVALTGVAATVVIGGLSTGLVGVAATAVVGLLQTGPIGVFATAAVGSLAPVITQLSGVYATVSIGAMSVISAPTASPRWTLRNTIARTFTLKSH